MTATVFADNFSSHRPKRSVLMPDDGAGNTLKKSRPTATGIELSGRFVQWSITACAGVDSRDSVFVVFASA